MRKTTSRFINKMKPADRTFFNRMMNASSDSDFKVLARTNKDDKPAELLIMGDIGDSWWGEAITGKEVTMFLADHRGIDVKVKMDSGGGDVYDGMTMMNALLQHDAAVEGEIMGLCFSAASYVILGCDRVEAHATSNFGGHPAATYAYGNQYSLQDTVRWLDSIDNLILDVYEDKTGMDRDDLFTLFKGEFMDGTIMSATEALEYGFIDAVIPLRNASADEEDADEPEVAPAADDESPEPQDASGPTPRAESVDPKEDRESAAREFAAHRRQRKLQMQQHDNVVRNAFRSHVRLLNK